MNGLCPSGLPIAPAVRSWLLDECKLIEFGGPELDRTLGMAAHAKVQHKWQSFISWQRSRLETVSGKIVV
jgi:hypothetical protein